MIGFNDKELEWIKGHRILIDSGDFKAVYSEAKRNFHTSGVLESKLFPVKLNQALYELGCNILEEGDTKVPDQFFWGSSIKEFTIPSTVTRVGNEAFWNCKELERVDLPKGLVILGNSCFEDCKKLRSITLGGKIRAIPRLLFKGCVGLQEIKYLGTVDEWQNLPKGVHWNDGLQILMVDCSNGKCGLGL